MCQSRFASRARNAARSVLAGWSQLLAPWRWPDLPVVLYSFSRHLASRVRAIVDWAAGFSGSGLSH